MTCNWDLLFINLVTYWNIRLVPMVHQTRSPFFRVVTPSPTSTISSAGSWPRIRGKLREKGNSPFVI